jgi:predicted aldo/keto reductase-like oxidoreductase
MDHNKAQQLRFCLACQNPCRIMFPAGVQFKESSSCSPMATLAYSLLKGNIDLTDDVRSRLSDTKGCEACKSACPYGVDVAALAAEVVKEFTDKR